MLKNPKSINTPTRPCIECDGWYLKCPTCWLPDIEPFTERCEKCNQLFSWEWLSKDCDKEKKEMELINIDRFIGLVTVQRKTVQQSLILKKYIPIKDKLKAIDDFIEEVIQVKDNKITDIDPIEKYIKFTLMALKLYTNLDLEGTYEEYDKLQSKGLIDKIFKEVKSDYMDLKDFMDMRFEHKLAYYYSSIAHTDEEFLDGSEK